MTRRYTHRPGPKAEAARKHWDWVAEEYEAEPVVMTHHTGWGRGGFEHTWELDFGTGATITLTSDEMDPAGRGRRAVERL